MEQNEHCFECRQADYNVQPVGQTRVGIVGPVLVSVALQRWDVAVVSVTSNGAALSKCGLRKFFGDCSLDIWNDYHREVAGIA